MQMPNIYIMHTRSLSLFHAHLGLHKLHITAFPSIKISLTENNSLDSSIARIERHKGKKYGHANLVCGERLSVLS
jgi:hypothetical protein